ncbi:hypothetical protein ACFV2U_32675 [Streptomyces sp. NPDC059697]|uniref:hypothetical protein n=1 Tax=Streptomyces sp. NPDC059697 TaxID=3346912 RepID=UPI00368E3C08
MRTRTAAYVAALLAALTACTSRAPAPTPAPAKPVEVTQYGTEMSHGHLVFAAQYTIRNVDRSPIEYKIAFKFDGDGMGAANPKWVTRTVGAQKTYTGTVSVPWERGAASIGVEISQVQQIPL